MPHFERIRRRVDLPALAALLATTGCISAPTAKRLDQTYDAATTHEQHVQKPPTSEPNAALDVDLSAPLDRDAVVAAAVAKSPSLALISERAKALVHAGRAEGALPAPELGFEAWNLPLTRPYAMGDAEMYMVELRQRFPAAGALDGRARAMAEEAQAMLAELSDEERAVAQGAADAYADYVQAFAERALQTQQLALLDRMAQATAARFTTGGASLAEAARIDLEIAKTQRAIARIDGEIARARAGLNALLRRPVHAPLGEPRRIGHETVRLSIDELLTRAEASRGPALSAQARVRAAAARREAAAAEAHTPEFMVGLGYWQDPRMRPGIGITASMTMPWAWGPQSHRYAQAQAEEAAQHAEHQSAEVDTQSEISDAHAQLAASEQQLRVVSSQALPAARRSIDALTAAFSTGNASLLEWVDVARSVLDLELEAAALHAELSHGIAALERAVGVALPRVPLDEEQAP